MDESHAFQRTYSQHGHPSAVSSMLGPTVSEQLALDPFGSVIRSLVAGGLGGATVGGWWMRLVAQPFEDLM